MQIILKSKIIFSLKGVGEKGQKLSFCRKRTVRQSLLSLKGVIYLKRIYSLWYMSEYRVDPQNHFPFSYNSIVSNFNNNVFTG